MSKITWDDTGKRYYEAGVSKGVLYIPTDGVYKKGVAWNGLTAVNEQPSGAEATKLWADNIQYGTLYSAEEFGGTIEAYTYPEEFEQCDGSASPSKGVSVGQQPRSAFGLSYVNQIGNETAGYKLHLVYGATASPSEKNRQTINDSPEVTTFSWDFTTTPVPVSESKPTAHIVIDSTRVESADNLTALEKILYGDGETEPRLPLPDEVLKLIKDGSEAV